MDKFDFCLFPLVYFLRMKFTILPVAMFLVLTPSTTGREIKNGEKWKAIFCLHPILLVLSGLHNLIQISILQTALSIVLKFSMVRICLYWMRFYFSPFKSKENRQPIWEIITNPVHPDRCKTSEPSNKIVCFNQNLCCLSY